MCHIRQLTFTCPHIEYRFYKLCADAPRRTIYSPIEEFFSPAEEISSPGLDSVPFSLGATPCSTGGTSLSAGELSQSTADISYQEAEETSVLVGEISYPTGDICKAGGFLDENMTHHYDKPCPRCCPEGYSAAFKGAWLRPRDEEPVVEGVRKVEGEKGDISKGIAVGKGIGRKVGAGVLRWFPVQVKKIGKNLRLGK
jgi:hypothetical protein